MNPLSHTSPPRGLPQPGDAAAALAAPSGPTTTCIFTPCAADTAWPVPKEADGMGTSAKSSPASGGAP